MITSAAQICSKGAFQNFVITLKVSTDKFVASFWFFSIFVQFPGKDLVNGKPKVQYPFLVDWFSMGK